MSHKNIVVTESKRSRHKSRVERAAERVDFQQGSSPALKPDESAPATESAAPIEAPPKIALEDEAVQRQTIKMDQDLCGQLNICAETLGRSAVAEEFRFIKRSVLQISATLRSQRLPQANIVLVTSAGPNEGKTFTAVNLALSIAQEQDLSAVLLDADFGNADASRLFSSHEEPGLTDLLGDPALKTEDVIRRTEFGRLSFIPAGLQKTNTAELVASKRMLRLLSFLSDEHPERILLIDAPPALAMSEASILASYAGQVLFVVEADKTNKLAAKRAVTLLDGCAHIGLILNKLSDPFGTASYGKSYRS